MLRSEPDIIRSSRFRHLFSDTEHYHHNFTMLLSSTVGPAYHYFLHSTQVVSSVASMNTLEVAVASIQEDYPLAIIESTQQSLLGHSMSASSSSCLASSSSLLFLFRGITHLQSIGENVFAAAFFIALIQASVAFISYRTNPVGELIVPPGPTLGVEDPSNEIRQTPRIRRNKREKLLLSYHEMAEEIKREENDSDSNSSTVASTDQSRYSRIINRVNSFLPLLLPLLSRQLSYVVTRNSHLFHIGFVGTLIKLFDIPTRFFLSNVAESIVQDSESNTKTTAVSKGFSEISRVCVIGDSLAVGLGTVDFFDKNKNSTLAKCRIENLNPSPGTESPEFPRVFARTLATLRQSPVSWRSAGVDGGLVPDINEFCFGVIQEETAQGRPPDVVVIICGINDLRHFVAKPWGAYSARSFRRSLAKLITDIREISPGCKVLLPGLPTQMFHKNSPLNIFPLAFFLDTIVGFFDSQKKLVADCFPSKDVMYLGISASDIADWYHDEHKSLIAADGVHPNKRCYALWAEFMAKGLYATLLPEA
jgi:lysophospholipase L1-like esterase